MNRAELFARAADRREAWDVAVVGGGATGVGVAVDAAARGYSVLLVERGDFGTGTSSRSTKLVHGGVRYLRQGHLGLVLGALRERGRLRRNAPHLVHGLPFVLPCYSRWEVAQYAVGLTTYDLLAGRHRFGRSRTVTAAGVQKLLPTVQPAGLRGGVVYHDGQFDDARLLLALVRTAHDLGAVVLNYAPVTGLLRSGSAVTGLIFHDAETGREVQASARVVVNAAGPFCDEVRRLAAPTTPPLLTASRGSHVVLPRAFLPTDHALLVPDTPDGRVLFALPWHGHTVVGTTDVPVPAAEAEPRASLEEIDYILETAGRYLARPPGRGDVLSTFAGIRPLVKAGAGVGTAQLSRDHTIRVDAPGLLTLTGGKWTTYRSMAEDGLTRAAELAGLPRRPCRTADLKLNSSAACGFAFPHPEDVARTVRDEMARTVEDVLARRSRALLLNAREAVSAAPMVAGVIAAELGKDDVWVADELRRFHAAAGQYLPPVL